MPPPPQPPWTSLRQARGPEVSDGGGRVVPAVAVGDPVLRLPAAGSAHGHFQTNAIESLHMRLRKIVKNRWHFPGDEAATKLLFLVLRNTEKDWKLPQQRTWKQAANQFAIMFGERFRMRLTRT